MERQDKKYHKSSFYWLWRTLILWIGSSLGFLLIADLSVGLTINNWTTAFIAAAVVGILNAILWPLLSRLLLPFMVFTVGIGALLINGALIWLASNFVPGITIEGTALILTPIGMAAISTILNAIVTIDDDAAWYRSIRSAVKKFDNNNVKDTSGIIFMEIDGLAKNILLEAIERGDMPTLKRWIDKGSHVVSGWETDLSSQTGASQAGILHGNNQDVLAFRWVEKENNNRFMESTGLNDAPIVEERISDGNGLLSINGASRSNLFSGDAEDVIFTFSKLKHLKKFYNRAWYYVFSNPSNFSRIVCLFLWDALLDYKSQIMHRLRNIRPRIYRGITFPFVRSGANVFLREVTTFALIGDVLEGHVDVAYVTYLGYDEIAHHSGIRDEDAFYALRGIDKQLHRVEMASQLAHRPYQLVVHSDHGQTNGATFKQRYGQTLEDVVKELLPAETQIYADISPSTGDHFVAAFTAPGDKVKGFFQDKTIGVNEYIQKYRVNKKPGKIKKKDANVMVLASGNFGMIYLTDNVERLNFEDINQIYPDLIPGLAKHEGIGFILVNSNEHGPLVIGNNGTYYLNDDTIEGENPLANFGLNAATHIRRTNNFKYTPDILAMSLYDPEKNEVAAFEELVGSHGGIGGEQSFPFILHPVEWDLGDDLIGAEKVHQAFKAEILKVNM
ncbi:MAG: phage holin family protein [Methanobacterium sp.]|uniref:phage holin family protein n=1 Tax=Methanobacterium sp. TaxID=2164 RepID=UPI003D65F844|nr:phage holin family protein [Methanobacterium sp.]